MKPRLFPCVLALLVASSVQAASINCGINSAYGSPVIDFSEISEGLRLEDFDESGQFGVTAVVTGNGKEATFATNLFYVKVGGRIELDEIYTLEIDYFTIDEFKSVFGLLPEVSCSTP